MDRALFAPAPADARRDRPARSLRRVPLFWRLFLVNLAIVLGAALLATWASEALVVARTLSPLSHALLVLAAIALSSSVMLLLLRNAFSPIRSLRAAIHRFNAGDRTVRADVGASDDPDVVALAAEVNALWDRLEADAATIREKTEQAERLAAQVILVQEEERRRVARELHDEAGQALTALIIGLERGLAAMPESYASDLPVQPRKLVSDLRDLAVQTLDEVRKLALELRPSVLDDLGLAAALRQYLVSVEERTGLTIRFSVTGFEDGPDAPRLPPAVETALFRIAQEAVTNAVRHARARSVQVRLRWAEQTAGLEVRDDGVGIPPLSTEERPGEHLGLFGMRERARLLHGTFTVVPVSPRGTLVQVSLPVPAEQATAP